MGVVTKRSSGAYIASLVCAGVVAVLAVAITWAKTPSSAWMYSLHPSFMSLGFLLIVVGLLENVGTPVRRAIGPFVGVSLEGQQGQTGHHGVVAKKYHLSLHVYCMFGAFACFALGWLFMFLQHRKAGASHFASESAVTHKLHVYGGYLTLALLVGQFVGGLVKNSKWPQPSVKWHGVVGRVIPGVMFFWVLVFASWAGLTPKNLVKDDSFLMSEPYLELMFCALFVGTGVFVFVTLAQGHRPVYQDKKDTLSSSAGESGAEEKGNHYEASLINRDGQIV